MSRVEHGTFINRLVFFSILLRLRRCSQSLHLLSHTLYGISSATSLGLLTLLSLHLPQQLLKWMCMALLWNEVFFVGSCSQLCSTLKTSRKLGRVGSLEIGFAHFVELLLDEFQCVDHVINLFLDWSATFSPASRKHISTYDRFFVVHIVVCLQGFLRRQITPWRPLQNCQHLCALSVDSLHVLEPVSEFLLKPSTLGGFCLCKYLKCVECLLRVRSGGSDDLDEFGADAQYGSSDM